MEVGEKLQMLKDYIAVNQASMSQLFFSKKWQIPLREFIEIAYVIEADKHAENKRLKAFMECVIEDLKVWHCLVNDECHRSNIERFVRDIEQALKEKK